MIRRIHAALRRIFNLNPRNGIAGGPGAATPPPTLDDIAADELVGETLELALHFRAVEGGTMDGTYLQIPVLFDAFVRERNGHIYTVELTSRFAPEDYRYPAAMPILARFQRHELEAMGAKVK